MAIDDEPGNMNAGHYVGNNLLCFNQAMPFVGGSHIF